MKSRFKLGEDAPFVRYALSSRSVLYSALFALPLFLLYEAMALIFREEVDNIRNGADVLLKQLLGLVGVHGLINVSLVMLVGLLVVIGYNRNQVSGPIRFRYFALMFGESILYGLGLGMVVSWIVQMMLLATGTGNLQTQIIISLGAGVYEELVFRVFLVSGLFLFLHRLLGFRNFSAYVISAVAAALIFSWFHYVGPLGDTWALHSFLYRFVAGLVLSGLYILRGYGITAYTHALYDLFVTFSAV